ncbi:MAG: hypothetical protein RLZZ528_2587 [Pseudomonadota bacterium]
MRFGRLVPLFLVLASALSGCITVVPDAPEPLPAATAPVPPALDAQTAARNFVTVVTRMEPMIEDECRRRAPGAICDFRIVVDDRPGQAPNAFQTLDNAGRPIIAFTVPLIAEVRNIDELAFIMGHEAAHHIAGHIPRQRQTAMTGALILGGIAAATGADAEGVRAAQNIGGSVGARTYSQDFELEADRLGAIIAFNAGYDPLLGAQFFARIPDPGNNFLGTHPPNAERLRVVRQTMRNLR